METSDMYFGWQDSLSLAFFILSWIGYARFSDMGSQSAKSLLTVTNGYRLQWMREMIRRENRTMDAIMIGNLQRSIAFFANTTIFIVLGLVTMLGYQSQSSEIISHIPFAAPSTPFLWEMKILLLIVIFIYAFFKYTWSMRQYNYAGIFVNSLPPHEECREQLDVIAGKGSYLIGNAAKHFNNGLRAYYFGLAALAWFVHPLLFAWATAWVVYVTHRREYHSTTLANLAK